jgi:error-prone DNA polymerase
VDYAEHHCISNLSFLRGASHPAELVARAAALGYRAIAITDECSLAGIVRAHVAAREHGLKLIAGSEFRLPEDLHLVLLAPDRAAYSALSGLITLGRRRADKGSYALRLDDLPINARGCLAIWVPAADASDAVLGTQASHLASLFKGRLWLGVELLREPEEQQRYLRLHAVARAHAIPMVACGGVEMHEASRKSLADVLAAVRLGVPVQQLGKRIGPNAERHLRPVATLARLYPPELLAESIAIAALCNFSLEELRYEYPEELVPAGRTAGEWLRELVLAGAARRWPGGIAHRISGMIEKELSLIAELAYEYYFLTVHDIVAFARSEGILCQGRGSAANSVVCYCLFITEVDPARVETLFERFISKERNEPPDIDVDFEHERREEVIQYIYRKYGRDHAALAASLITYRPRSAVRDVGKALGLDERFVAELAASLSWWDRPADLEQRFRAGKLAGSSALAAHFLRLLKDILGFPRHLSQHVGGFVITRSPISALVPVENAAMPERTVIQWDKDDIEALGMLKVDILALGMLSAIRRCFGLLRESCGTPLDMSAIPADDPATFDMLCEGDSVGVFQVESRAQMAMLPRLRPRTFYDLVIQIAIVRPGPIQGDMVHPYLRRRQGQEAVSYPNEEIRGVLARTLGVPIFQEQVIKLAMVAAGFSGGEADQLRRAMAAWSRNGTLMAFRDKVVNGMLARGHPEEFAERLFNQMKGFGDYGFPESHAASFALLAYASAWLKRHHPAAFCCALLNSQPMGFYSPSQLVQDLRRHGVQVLPVDVNHSLAESSLDARGAAAPALRLGLHLVKGLRTETAHRLAEARPVHGFRSMAELTARAGLDRGEVELLAQAGALATLAGNRHQAHWQARAIEPFRPLLGSAEPDDGVRLPAPTESADVVADYRSLGLSLGRHPVALLRERGELERCCPAAELPMRGSGRFVRVGGLVTCRQRPGTASGVLFLTLEDDTGNINVVVWKDRQERFRKALLGGRLLLVKGIVENRDAVVHVIAGEIIDRSEALGGIESQSRDFH